MSDNSITSEDSDSTENEESEDEEGSSSEDDEETNTDYEVEDVGNNTDDEGGGSNKDCEDSTKEKNAEAVLSDGDSSGTENPGQRCPICLNRFIGQELGSPPGCDHTFCLECIYEWSKKIPNCPLDRIEFEHILVRLDPEGDVIRKVAVPEPERDVEDDLPQDTTACEVCGRSDREDRLLLCDSCDLAYHCECLSPPLEHIPIDHWYCPPCASVLDDLGTRQTAQGSRRAIARTRVSETVRSRIEQQRTQLHGGPSRATFSRTSSTRATTSRQPTRKRVVKRRRRKRRRYPVKAEPKLARTKKSIGDAFGKKGALATPTRKIRRRKKRVYRRRKTVKRTKRSQLSSRRLPVPSVRGRLAEQLGMCKPPPGHKMPYVKKSSSGRQEGSSAEPIVRYSLFGDKNQLMDFDEDFADTEATSSSSTSRAPATNAFQCSVSPIDLLGSIMSGQKILHTESKYINIGQDGSLRMIKESKKPGKAKVLPRTEKVVNSENCTTILEDDACPSTSNPDIKVLVKVKAEPDTIEKEYFQSVASGNGSVEPNPDFKPFIKTEKLEPDTGDSARKTVNQRFQNCDVMNHFATRNPDNEKPIKVEKFEADEDETNSANINHQIRNNYSNSEPLCPSLDVLVSKKVEKVCSPVLNGSLNDDDNPIHPENCSMNNTSDDLRPLLDTSSSPSTPLLNSSLNGIEPVCPESYLPNDNSPERYSPSNSPERYSPNNSPENYSPNNSPERYSPNNSPERYSPNNSPDRYPPNNSPERYSPNNSPERYSPNNSPERYSPNNSPDRYSPNNFPERYSPTDNSPESYSPNDNSNDLRLLSDAGSSPVSPDETEDSLNLPVSDFRNSNENPMTQAPVSQGTNNVSTFINNISDIPLPGENSTANDNEIQIVGFKAKKTRKRDLKRRLSQETKKEIPDSEDFKLKHIKLEKPDECDSYLNTSILGLANENVARVIKSEDTKSWTLANSEDASNTSVNHMEVVKVEKSQEYNTCTDLAATSDTPVNHEEQERFCNVNISEFINEADNSKVTHNAQNLHDFKSVPVKVEPTEEFVPSDGVTTDVDINQVKFEANECLTASATVDVDEIDLLKRTDGVLSLKKEFKTENESPFAYKSIKHEAMDTDVHACSNGKDSSHTSGSIIHQMNNELEVIDDPKRKYFVQALEAYIKLPVGDLQQQKDKKHEDMLPKHVHVKKEKHEDTHPKHVHVKKENSSSDCASVQKKLPSSSSHGNCILPYRTPIPLVVVKVEKQKEHSSHKQKDPQKVGQAKDRKQHLSSSQLKRTEPSDEVKRSAAEKQKEPVSHKPKGSQTVIHGKDGKDCINGTQVKKKASSNEVKCNAVEKQKDNSSHKSNDSKKVTHGKNRKEYLNSTEVLMKASSDEAKCNAVKKLKEHSLQKSKDSKKVNHGKNENVAQVKTKTPSDVAKHITVEKQEEQNSHKLKDPQKLSKGKEKKEHLNGMQLKRKAPPDEVQNNAVKKPHVASDHNKTKNTENDVITDKTLLISQIENAVKGVLKPYYLNSTVSKEDYKEIMRKSVPKILRHSADGVINLKKIQALILSYISFYQKKGKVS